MTVNGLYYLVEYLKLQLLITGHRCECLAIWFLLIDLHEGIWAWQALNFLLALKLHDSSLWLCALVMTLCILDHEFHAWAPPSIAQNPKEQSAMQGHTMTWRPRLESHSQPLHSGDLPDPGMESKSLVSPALAGRFFTTVSPWNCFPWRKKW